MFGNKALPLCVCIAVCVSWLVPAEAAARAPKCGGKRVTIVGTEKRDKIEGTRKSDVIATLGGNDTVDGKRGNDRICTGAGRDMVLESRGDDTTDGGLGADTLSFENARGSITANLDNAVASGNGADKMTRVESMDGSSFGDELTGDERRNSLDGKGGNDVVQGGDGRDFLRGRAGSDEIHGGPGGDEIRGHEGDDSLLGDSGNDLLDGGTPGSVGFALVPCQKLNSGSDLLDGGEGADELAGCDGDDTVDGGPGSDEADFAGARTAVTVNLATNSASGEGADQLLNMEDVEGSDFDDTIEGDGNDNRLSGGYVHLEGNSDEFVGGWGNDRLLGVGGNDILDGGADDDELDGGSGVDMASFYTCYWYKNQAWGPFEADLSTGTATGDGTDTMTGVEDLRLNNPCPGRARVTGDSASNRILVDSSGRDVVWAGGGNDFVFTDGGRDQIHGEEGDDALVGGNGRDAIDGGEGMDACSDIFFDVMVNCEEKF
jgi:Ca2+-binding RTX toxin-like protein